MDKTGLRRVTAAVLIGATVAANAAFFGLGSSFQYPDVLQKPTGEILELFVATRSSTMAWFALLALGAALLAPAAVLLSRLYGGRAARLSMWVGVGAAIVQVVGLSRWFLLVPGYSARATDASASAAQRAEAIASFETAHRILGSLVGETFGYVLTAGWTVLVVIAIGRARAGSWFLGLGLLSACLIALGVFVPFGLPGADMANLAGYVIWSIWLLVLAGKLLRNAAGATPVDPRLRPLHSTAGGST
jgi:hypothetical protein